MKLSVNDFRDGKTGSDSYAVGSGGDFPSDTAGKGTFSNHNSQAVEEKQSAGNYHYCNL